MTKIKSILKGAKNLAFAAFLAGGLWLNSGCNNPVEPIIPPVPPKPLPSMSLTAELVNDVNLKYAVNMKNLNGARINISKSENQLLSRTISDSAYTETLSYSTNKNITKGNYVFTLNGKTLAGRDTSITANVAIPNYAPTINTTGLQTGFDEGGEANISLRGKLTDKNPEDNPVCIKEVIPVDGKTFVNVSEENLQIKNLGNQTGIYQIRVDVGNSGGGVSTSTLHGNIEDLFDVKGVLEDTKLHSRQPGIVKIYDEKIEPSTGKNRKLGEIEVSQTGEFSKRLNYRVKDLVGHVLVQGRGIRNKTDTTSYMKTTKLPKADINGLELSVVSYDGLAENGISINDFEKHAYEVLENPETFDDVTTRYTLWKWDFGEFNSTYPFKEIIISKQPENTNISAYFNQTTAENIKSRILDKEDIGSWFNGKITSPDKVRIVDKWNLDYNDGSLNGRIVVYPSVNKNEGGITPNNGYAKYGTIWVQTKSNGELIWTVDIAHEFGHANGQKHTKTLSPIHSIMGTTTINNDPLNPQPLFADKKTAREIVYVDSYKHGQGKDADGLLRVYDVLGRRFLDE